MKNIAMRKKSAVAVVAASRHWAATTTEGLAELLRPELAEGESLPDLELLQELLGRALARRWQCLEAADQAREQTYQRRRLRGKERFAARAVLYRRVVDLRRLLRGVFGGAACRRLLGIAGETSREDRLLLRQARHIVARLAVSSNALPAVPFQLTVDDLARWAAPVEEAIETLEDASRLAAIDVKEAEAADAELRRVMADFDSVFVRVASMLTGVHTGAGQEQTARAVRPSRRRLGRLLTDDDRPGRRRGGSGRAAKGRATKGRMIKAGSVKAQATVPPMSDAARARGELPRPVRKARWSDPAVALARAG